MLCSGVYLPNKTQNLSGCMGVEGHVHVHTIDRYTRATNPQSHNSQWI